MSPWTKTELPPAPVISAFVASPRSLIQSTQTRFAPSRDSRLAAAAPMPRADPVTITVLPAKRPGV